MVDRKENYKFDLGVKKLTNMLVITVQHIKTMNIWNILGKLKVFWSIVLKIGIHGQTTKAQTKDSSYHSLEQFSSICMACFFLWNIPTFTFFQLSEQYDLHSRFPIQALFKVAICWPWVIKSSEIKFQLHKKKIYLLFQGKS